MEPYEGAAKNAPHGYSVPAGFEIDARVRAFLVAVRIK